MKLPLTPDMAYRFDGLYQWLHRKYELEMVKLDIAGHSFKLYKVADVDAALELAAAEGTTGNDLAPYWAELWPSARALSDYILNGANMDGKQVLEIGCGLGLVGMACHKAGADVLLTDLLPDALRISELNWIVNFQESPEIASLDWRVPPSGQAFECIVAADVLYEKQAFLPILHTFEMLLARDGRILLAEPNRPIAAEFFALLKARGFSARQFTREVTTDGRVSTVSIYEIQRQS